jgi:hypothetical protein
MTTKRFLRYTALSALLLSGCGEPTVTASNDSYEPRIVVEALLMPGSPVTRIRVARNLRVTANLRTTVIPIDDASVVLTVDATGSRHVLTYHRGAPFDFRDHYYEYRGDDLTIEHGASYTLEVEAVIERQSLAMRATTTVPQPGFRIASISHDRLPYRPVGPDGEVVDVQMQIERSPGTPLYLMTVVALDASAETFVYDNPFTDEDPDDLDVFDFNYEYEWLQNPPLTAGTSTMNVFWWDLWYYSDYQIVVYAADANYARFIQTFDEVQEQDGNFHEPEFAIEGDGIGYFGSAIADTVSLTITR